jgi:AcrR family transcriptional regulator
MSSHKSTPLAPVAPSRRRGHLRVAAILDAATRLFAERRYDTVTMTAIAAASGTAIGSLYRFFPTKEVLAEALLGRYAARIEDEFDRIEAVAAGQDGGALADALLARFTGEDPDRDAVLALLETRNDGADARRAIRAGVLRRVTALVRIAAPDLSEREVGARAGMLLRLLKLAGEGEAGGEAALVVRIYVRERVRA